MIFAKLQKIALSVKNIKQLGCLLVKYGELLQVQFKL